MYKLRNKIILIPGGLGLIGKEISKNLALEGAKVIVLDLKKNKLKKKFFFYSKNEGQIIYIKCNINNVLQLNKIKKQIIKKFKRLDVLINLAAITDAVESPKDIFESKFENFSIKKWNKSIQTNLTSIFLLCKIFGSIMVNQREGSIINFSSTYGIVAPDQSLYLDKNLKPFYYKNPAYPTTKGGVISFTRYLAAYWGGKNIRVNCISPGGIENNQNKIFIQNYSNKTPLKRMGKPTDLNGVIKLLSSDESKYITGSNLIVDGGWTAV